MNSTDTFPEETTHLTKISQGEGSAANGNRKAPICLALAHNEEHIIRQFLNHYRAMGVSDFVIIDDHSTDQTGDILAAQKDVTIYQPKPGSTYKEDKVAWRCDLLDHSSDGRWVLLPDIDEHFIYPDMETSSLGELIEDIEREGGAAMFTIMVDMYADKPLGDHLFTSGSLSEAFPYFDNPTKTNLGYRLLPPASRFLEKYPTPPICAYGGVRDRIFFTAQGGVTGLKRWMLHKYAHINRPLEPGFVDRLLNSLTRQLTKKLFGSEPLSMTKLGLLKWKKGMVLSGGPHAVSGNHKLASKTSAFLHYKFTKGAAGLQYVAKRGQHAGGSVLYRKMLDQQELFEQSPHFEHSVKFEGSRTLLDCGLIRK